jgi:hypothetical protein
MEEQTMRDRPETGSTGLGLYSILIARIMQASRRHLLYIQYAYNIQRKRGMTMSLDESVANCG